jgi:hypothetical protein
MLAEHVIEELRVTTEVADQVAHLCTNVGIRTVNLLPQLLVDVDLVDRLIVFLSNASQLGQDVQRIENNT